MIDFNHDGSSNGRLAFLTVFGITRKIVLRNTMRGFRLAVAQALVFLRTSVVAITPGMNITLKHGVLDR
jgi:hypothetical protein